MSDDFVSLSLNLHGLFKTQTSHLLQLSQNDLNLHEIVFMLQLDDKISGHINRTVSVKFQFTQLSLLTIYKTFTILNILAYYWSIVYFW